MTALETIPLRMSAFTCTPSSPISYFPLVPIRRPPINTRYSFIQGESRRITFRT